LCTNTYSGDRRGVCSAWLSGTIADNVVWLTACYLLLGNATYAGLKFHRDRSMTINTTDLQVKGKFRGVITKLCPSSI
jgi:hypothetical protein